MFSSMGRKVKETKGGFVKCGSNKSTKEQGRADVFPSIHIPTRSITTLHERLFIYTAFNHRLKYIRSILASSVVLETYNIKSSLEVK